MNADMERRIAQNGVQPHRCCVDAVTGQHLGLQAICGKCQARTCGGKGIDIKHDDFVVRVTTLDGRPQHSGATTEVEQVAAGQLVDVFQQQG